MSPDMQNTAEATDVLASMGLQQSDVDALHASHLPARPLLQALKTGQPVAEVLGLPPRSVDLIYSQAFALLNAGRASAARRLFAALCVLDGRNVDHWLGHGLCLVAAGAMREAKLAFTTAHSLAPAAAAPAFHLATLALKENDRTTAAAFLQIFAAAPNGPEKSTLAPAARQMINVLAE